MPECAVLLGAVSQRRFGAMVSTPLSRCCVYARLVYGVHGV